VIKRGKRYIRCLRPEAGAGFVAPALSAGALRIMRAAGRCYLRFAEGVSHVSLLNPQPLTEAYREFESRQKRLIIAFRHVSRADAPVLLYALSRLLPAEAKRAGTPLAHTPHALFLYGKDVLNWAGKGAAWLFPRIGNIPVINGEPNREGLTILRREAAFGPYPIALAPEGQVTYHMHRCFPIAAGPAALAEWGLESGTDVSVLPAAIGYRYSEDPGAFTLQVLRRWERRTGFKVTGSGSSGRALWESLLKATDLTLGQLESIYRTARIHAQTSVHTLRLRMAAVCEAALTAAETAAGIEGTGSVLERLFRIRYAGVRTLYPERYDPNSLSPLSRSIADYRSIEARVYLRHGSIVDVLEYLDPEYISPDGPPVRFCEYALNLLDIVNRMEGGDISSRYSPHGVHACVLPGTPLSAEDYFREDSSGSRRESRRRLTEELGTQLQKLSDELCLTQAEP